MSDIEEEEHVWVSESLWRHELVGAGCLQPELLLPFRAKLRLLRPNACSSRRIRSAPDVGRDVPTLPETTGCRQDKRHEAVFQQQTVQNCLFSGSSSRAL